MLYVYTFIYVMYIIIINMALEALISLRMENLTWLILGNLMASHVKGVSEFCFSLLFLHPGPILCLWGGAQM